MRQQIGQPFERSQAVAGALRGDEHIRRQTYIAQIFGPMNLQLEKPALLREQNMMLSGQVSMRGDPALHRRK